MADDRDPIAGALPRHGTAAADAVAEGPPGAVPAYGARPEDAAAADAVDQSSLRRRMPSYLRRFLLRVQGGRLYLPAAQRLVWFRDECPEWGIETVLIEGGQEAGFATVRATVHNQDGRLIASGLKTETRQDFPAGWVEKAETGAIARALAVAGFGTQFSPELDEGDVADSPQWSGVGPRPGPDVVPARPAPAPRAGAPAPAPDAAAQPASPPATVEAPPPSTPRRAPVAVWEGPGLCPQCHAPEGKKHARKCTAGAAGA